MFKKKDTPELYELLRKNRVEVGKPYPKEASASSAAQPSASPEEPHGAAPTIPELTAPSPYHKLRNPFPVKIEKPVKKTIGGKRIPANYNNLIFGAIVIVILAFVIYAVFFRSGNESAAAPDATGPTPGGTVAPLPVPTPPVQPAKYWGIRLAYARDNTSERETILRLQNFLSDKKISDVSLEMETIKGSKCIVIYQGKYKTKDEAAKETARFRNLHFKFKECTVESRNAPK
jgi:hypothetical protein